MQTVTAKVLDLVRKRSKMCFSAMVEQDARKLGLKFQARIQYEMYAELFARRLAGEKLLLNKAMERQFLAQHGSEQEQQIAESIYAWHEKRASEIETEIFKQRERQANAERALSFKATKKAQDDLRISSSKIGKFKMDLQRYRSWAVGNEADERIFPFHFFSMLTLDEKDEKVIRPFRYHMRPHDRDEHFDREFGGCYNARFDNLTRVGFWRDSLERRRGLVVVHKFYENVPVSEYAKRNRLPQDAAEQTNIVLCFEPDQEMVFIPTLWDAWTAPGSPPLMSAALITDEPLAEIAAAGHDRTPIFLKENAVDDWLRADSRDRAIEILKSERERPHHTHRLVSAA